MKVWRQLPLWVWLLEHTKFMSKETLLPFFNLILSCVIFYFDFDFRLEFFFFLISSTSDIFPQSRCLPSGLTHRMHPYPFLKRELLTTTHAICAIACCHNSVHAFLLQDFVLSSYHPLSTGWNAAAFSQCANSCNPQDELPGAVYHHCALSLLWLRDPQANKFSKNNPIFYLVYCRAPRQAIPTGVRRQSLECYM